MNKLIVPAIIVAAAVATPAWSQAPQPQEPRFQPKPYFEMPLEKDPTRQVRLQSVVIPAGAGNQFHRHPGDQWWAVQEGEVTFTVKGQPPRTLKLVKPDLTEKVGAEPGHFLARTKEAAKELGTTVGAVKVRW